jgi:hypothetical protein
MTVAEMGQRMTFYEFKQWLALYKMEDEEREGRRSGKQPEMTDDEMLAAVKALNTQLGGTVVEA